MMPSCIMKVNMKPGNHLLKTHSSSHHLLRKAMHINCAKTTFTYCVYRAGRHNISRTNVLRKLNRQNKGENPSAQLIMPSTKMNLPETLSEAMFNTLVTRDKKVERLSLQ